VMLIDSAKGVEAQTKKLFAVCRRRGIPIFTFVNKLDRPGRDPFDLLHEVEEVLGIRTVAVTWPFGQGQDFTGVATLFEALGPEARRRPVPDVVSSLPPASENGVSDPDKLLSKLADEVELLAHAGDPFDHGRILRGELSPAFFGSAWNEIGVDEFLAAFVKLAPPPGPRHTTTGDAVDPLLPSFSGFVFKIQANMDPAHRDRLAFLRVCSGRFERGMSVKNIRDDKDMRLSMPHQLFGKERQVIEEAYPGDVIGLFDTGALRIGDTLCEEPAIEFAELPRFSPEIFARLRSKDALKRKQLEKGLLQLSQEGAIQVFAARDAGLRDPILGAVGALQLEVLQYRLRHEYGAEIALERLPYTVARWIRGKGFDPGAFEQEVDAFCVVDRDQNPLALFKSEWNLSYAQGRHPEWTFSPTVMTSDHSA
jgi:peptide chain release factor 3